MNYKANIRPAWVVLVMLMVFTLAFTLAFTSDQNATSLVTALKNAPETEKADLSKFKNSEENENCLKCHGQSSYSYENKESGKTVKKKMYAELILNRDEYYISNHREFKCTDCHSEDYGTFPHDGNLRMEAKATCIDCHGGDEQYAKFEFEKIDTAFMASVHSQKHSDDFTCWMCHNPHTYKINARTTDNLKETITYDNLICLNCHGDVTRYQLLTDKQRPNLIDKHDWLPNQAAHFTNVRCIECHARNEDTLIVAHHVAPKKEALRKCESCHSRNSILNASLYKYQVKEKIEKTGLLQGLLLQDTLTIGPDQNNTLNLISWIIFGFTLLVIFIHAYFRIKK
jgi:Zn finger protein HypA/HybF involved in hydrogenase expression